MTYASFPTQPPRGRWILSLALALALHLTVVSGLGLWSRVRAPVVRVPVPQPIELVFAAPPAPAEATPPEHFTELPPDRVDSPPAQADFLSNVTSRARDSAPGGEESMPLLEGRATGVGVQMTPGATGETVSEQPVDPEAAIDPTGEVPNVPDASPPSGTNGREVDAKPELFERRSEVTVDGLVNPTRSGNRDIFQEEMKNPTGNAALFGVTSLNTTSWAYAPWIMQLKRDFYRNLEPPPAYFLGLVRGIHSLKLEVHPDGRLLSIEVLESETHKSLETSTIGAFRAAAPFLPLPKDFPEPTLVLTVSMEYIGPRR